MHGHLIYSTWLVHVVTDVQLRNVWDYHNAGSYTLETW